jgi:hypothetical protein
MVSIYSKQSVLLDEQLHEKIVTNESLTHSDSDSDNDKDFIWENMQNYGGQRVTFTDNVIPQGAAKHDCQIGDTFRLFCNKEY